jgi:hypothetical protein
MPRRSPTLTLWVIAIAFFVLGFLTGSRLYIYVGLLVLGVFLFMLWQRARR